MCPYRKPTKVGEMSILMVFGRTTLKELGKKASVTSGHGLVVPALKKLRCNPQLKYPGNCLPKTQVSAKP
jgi:hypothetical protein